MVRGKLPASVERGETSLLRPEKIVFGHTGADRSADTLVARLASSVTYIHQLHAAASDWTQSTISTLVSGWFKPPTFYVSRQIGHAVLDTKNDP